MTTITAANVFTLRRLLAHSYQGRCSVGSRTKQCTNHRIACLSTKPETKKNNANPGDYVYGVTQADLEQDPRLQDYFASNFPSEFGTTEKDQDSLPVIEDMLDGDDSVPSSVKKEKSEVMDSEIDLMTKQCDLSLNIRPLIAYKRTIEGSRQCRVLRETTQMMPGIIYGSDPTKNILSIDSSSKISIQSPWKYIQRELDRFTYHNFESRVYDLTLFEDESDTEGTVHRVLPRNVQFHPIQNKIYCCNYLRYYPGRPIKIPIVYINEEESPAIKRGGFIAPFNRHVSCIVEQGVKIPEIIELDCTGARLKDVMRRDRLIFPEGVSPSHKVKENFLIGTVFGRRADVGTDE